MKVSIIGPSNIERLGIIINRDPVAIAKDCERIGKILAKNCTVTVLFNYAGMLKLIGDSYKKHRGSLEMLYTANDSDWNTKCYMHFLDEADSVVEKENWHEVLLSLVKDSDIVLCTGLSPGTFTELGYLKWNYYEGRGRTKKLIVIKDFLKEKQLLPEVTLDMQDFVIEITIEELEETINSLNAEF